MYGTDDAIDRSRTSQPVTSAVAVVRVDRRNTWSRMLGGFFAKRMNAMVTGVLISLTSVRHVVERKFLRVFVARGGSAKRDRKLNRGNRESGLSVLRGKACSGKAAEEPSMRFGILPNAVFR